MELVGTRRYGTRGMAWMVLRGLLCLVFLVGAGMKFAATPFEVTNFAHFGYAPWFMVLIGALELGGAVLLVGRRTAGLGAAALSIVMVGAVASHLGAGDGLGEATPAVVLLVLLILVVVTHGLPRRRSRVGLDEATA